VVDIALLAVRRGVARTRARVREHRGALRM